MPMRLGVRHRAHAVDEPAGGPHQCGRASEQHPLQRREFADVALGHPPARVGPAAQHAEAAARRVEEGPVEGLRGERRRRGVGHDRDHTRQPETRRGLPHHLDAPGVQVGRDDEPVVAHRLGRRGRLAPGRGGEIGDALTRLRVEAAHDRLARLVLGRRRPLSYRRERRWVAGRVEDQRVGNQPARRRTHAGFGDPRGKRRARRAKRVRSKRHRRGDVVDLQRRDRVVATELVEQRAHQPIGM